MSPPLPELITALLEPARYPHPVAGVELRESPVAWVLLAGDHAYRIAKPVRSTAVDLSTLALRRQVCEAELRLNRRFQRPDQPATQLYLGVLPLVGTPGSPRWGVAGTDDDRRAHAFALQMRRLDPGARLDRVIGQGALTPEHLTGLARRMAAVQARAAVAAGQQPWGHPAAAMRRPRANLATLRAALSAPDDAGRLDLLSRWTEQRFVAIEPLLSRRRQKERVREGHGDLSLAHLALIGDELLPFGAIGFSEERRWIDVASDMALTWMDLIDHGEPGLANVWLSAWLDASGDVSAPGIWDFFACHHAVARAADAAVHAGDPQASGARQKPLDLRVRALRYLALAQDIAQPPPPRLIITHGLSGSGKTWASGRWLRAEASGRAIRLRSDVERKRLYRVSPLAASGSVVNAGLYRPQAHAETFASLQSRTRMLLNEGWTVVVDAAFLRRSERQAFAALAYAVGCPFHLLVCEAPLHVLRQRITARQTAGDDASDATLAVLEQQLNWLEPLTPAERACALPE
jgi:aminoglycoside phosphotransferase family enzyme/predicted kinase